MLRKLKWFVAVLFVCATLSHVPFALADEGGSDDGLTPTEKTIIVWSEGGGDE